jgi:hypothetical protein
MTRSIRGLLELSCAFFVNCKLGCAGSLATEAKGYVPRVLIPSRPKMKAENK